MALQLKSGRTFVDDSLVEHSSGYFAAKRVVFEQGRIILDCNIWKDEATFLASLTDPSIKPLRENVGAVIQGANFVTYFLSPNPDGVIPSNFMNSVFYRFLTTEKPVIEGFDYNDWEIDLTPGVPATINPKR